MSDPFLDALTMAQPPGDAVAWAAYRRCGGLPDARDPLWRHTSLNPIRALAFSIAPDAAALDVSAVAALKSWLDSGVDAEGATERAGRCRLIVVDGVFRPELSDLPPPGVTITVAAALPWRAEDGASANAAVSVESPGWVALPALNAALGAETLRVRVAAGATPTAALCCLFLSTTRAIPHAAFPRLELELGPDAALTLLETHCALAPRGGATAPSAVTLSVPTVRCQLGAGAQLTHDVVQDEGPEAFSLASVMLRLAARACYDGAVAHVGARLARRQTQVALLAPGARATLAGAALIGAGRCVDDTVHLDHRARDGVSRATFHHAAASGGRGVFQARVVVSPGALGTDSHQGARGMMLGAGAEIVARPELEIHADDVRCGHGVACGDLDPEQLFYLRARGLDAAAARALLLRAFLLAPVADRPGVGGAAVRRALTAAAIAEESP